MYGFFIRLDNLCAGLASASYASLTFGQMQAQVMQVRQVKQVMQVMQVGQVKQVMQV